MRNLIAHVEAQPVYVESLDPEPDDVQKIILNSRVVGIEFGHVLCEGKRIIPSVPCIPALLQRPFVDHVPVGIFRCPTLLHNVLPHGMVNSGMVEHRIQHDSDAHGVSFIHQRAKVIVGTKLRIHLFIIPGVVLVITASLKYRI